MDSVPNLADAFREKRARFRLTQEEMARRLCITRNYLAKIETGKKTPSPRVVRSLETFGVDAEHVEEAPAPYGADEKTVAANLRARLEAVIAAAGGSPTKLAWLQEQMIAHISIPAHWRSSKLGRIEPRSAAEQPIPSSSRQSRSA